MAGGGSGLVLETERLILRPLGGSDAKTVQELAGDHEVARTTLHIPHPYPDGVAQNWIAGLGPAAAEGRVHTYAVVRKADGLLLGVVSLAIDKEHSRAELAYWLGRPYWGRGFTTEAARRMVEYGFAELGVHRICAYAMTKNAASTRVMQKIGMSYEGRLVHHIRKWDQYEDVDVYGMVKP